MIPRAVLGAPSGRSRYSGHILSLTRFGSTNTAVRTADGGLRWEACPGLLPLSTSWYGIAFDLKYRRAVATALGQSYSAWTDDLGSTWTAGGTLPQAASWYYLIYDPLHSRLVTAAGSYSTYSEDGGETWAAGGAMPSNTQWYKSCWDPLHGRLVYTSVSSTNSAYSTDGGTTWTAGGSLPIFAASLEYDPIHGRLVCTPSTGNLTAYSTDGGETWTVGGTLPNFQEWFNLVYDPHHKRLVTIGSDPYSPYSAYSLDGGESWTNGGAQSWWSRGIVYHHPRGAIVCCNYDAELTGTTPKAVYSLDGGASWVEAATLPPITGGPCSCIVTP